MPKNLLEALFYIYLLFPGLAYSAAREAHRPPSRRSAFRESATIVFVSVLCIGTVFLLAVLTGLFSADIRNWLSLLVLDSTQLIRNDSQFFFLVLVAALLAGTWLGWLLGGKKSHDLFLRLRDPYFDSRKLVDREQTTWQTLLIGRRGTSTYVHARLKNGALVEGYLYSYSIADSSSEWALTLRPVKYTYADGEVQDFDYSLVMIRAEDVDFVAVKYIRTKPKIGYYPKSSSFPERLKGILRRMLPPVRSQTPHAPT